MRAPLLLCLKLHHASHHDAHGDLTQAADNIPYIVPNEHVQVNWILKSIHIGYQLVIDAKTCIIINVKLQENFELSNYFLQFGCTSKYFKQ